MQNFLDSGTLFIGAILSHCFRRLFTAQSAISLLSIYESIIRHFMYCFWDLTESPYANRSKA